MTTAQPSPGVSHTIGSISQRTLVLPDLASSFTVATVPKENLGGESSLTRLASELYGVPRSSMITSQEYAKAIELIEHEEGTIWRKFQEDYESPFNGEAFLAEPNIDVRLAAYKQVLDDFSESWDHRRENWDTRALLARHGFLSQLGELPGIGVAQATLFPGQVPFSFVLENIHDGNALRYLSEQNLSSEAFLLALEVHDSALRPHYKVRAAVEELYGYMVPFGSSPGLRSESILNLLQRGRDAVVVRAKRHSEDMTRQTPNYLLMDLGNEVAGVGTRDVTDSLETATTLRSARRQPVT